LLLGKDPTLTGRTELWEVLLRESLNRPLIGHGLGYFMRPSVMAEFAIDFGWEAKTAHSSYVDLILGIGYIGTLVFIIFTVSIVSSSILNIPKINIMKQQCVAAITTVVSSLVVAAASSDSFLGTSSSWVLLVFCFLVSNNKIKKND
jgi:O-antigen ligase